MIGNSKPSALAKQVPFLAKLAEAPLVGAENTKSSMFAEE
jgi:hypothetical protein